MIEDRSSVERWLERGIFSSRWLLAPLYVGLAASLVVVLIAFARKFASLALGALTADSDSTIIGVLSLIDLALLANLILIVMFSGYETFVSRLHLDGHPDKPSWIGHVDFAGLKLKLMASIVAISAISLLEDFMHVEGIDNRNLAWHVGIHLTFVVSGVVLAVMDRVSPTQDH